MKKIILSSLYLRSLLDQSIDTLNPDGESYVMVSCINKRLSFSNCPFGMDVESTSDWKIEIQLSRIWKLNRLLSVLEDQPITILFKDSFEWIQIDGILI